MWRKLLGGVLLLGLPVFIASPASTGPAVFHRPIVAVGASQSNNWSGYNQGTLEKSGTMFHQVSGDWTVPTATAHKSGEAEYSATWVGIVPGSLFFPDGRGTDQVRLSFSLVDEALIDDGIERLAALVTP